MFIHNSHQSRWIQAAIVIVFAMPVTRGEEPPDAITAANQLARTGNYAAARVQVESALTHYKDDARTRARLLNWLASMYVETGDYDHAEKNYREAVAAAQEAIRAGDLDFLVTVTNLFALYMEYGQFTKADRFQRQLNSLGDGWRTTPHINVARLYSLSGTLAIRLERYAEAEPLLLRAAEMFKRLKLPPEIDLASLENNLAQLYSSTGRLEKARDCARRASERLSSLEGVSPGYLALVLVNRALLEQAAGDGDGAKKLFDRGMEIAQAQVSPTLPIMANILRSAADYLTLAGNKRDAKRLVKRAAAVQEAISHDTSIGKTVEYESFRSRVP